MAWFDCLMRDSSQVIEISRFTRIGGVTRFGNRVLLPRVYLVAIIPLEALHVAYNAVKLPFQAVLLVLKVPAFPLAKLTGLTTLDEYQESLSTPLDLLKTALKIVGFAIGLISSIVVGVISPRANIRIHVFLRLIEDPRPISILNPARRVS